MAALAAFYALPLAAQVVVAGALLLAGLTLLRILGNSLPGKAPPVDEGIPFVGGLIKFSKVRGALAGPAGDLMWRPRRCRRRQRSVAAAGRLPPPPACLAPRPPPPLSAALTPRARCR